MTNRTMIVIAGVVVVVGIVSLVIVNIVTHKSPQPLSESSAEPQKTTSQPRSPDKEEENGTDSESTFSEEDMASMLANGKQAAEAYVSQPPNETAVDRQARLKRFFIPTSPVISSPPPIQMERYSTADITPIETSWYPTGKDGVIGVIVYLKVEVNLPLTTRVENQTWQLELAPSGAGWLSSTITKSDLPYIEGV